MAPRQPGAARTPSLLPMMRHLLLLALLLASACASPRIPFTSEQQAVAVVPGFPNVRYFADDPALAEVARRAAARLPGEISYLALSGGGGDGAYGAGVLAGWTEAGTRPEFTIVSGVSTGALIAPFAFAGPARDDTLREMYTGGYGISLVSRPDFLNAIFGASLFDADRLRALLRRFVTPELVADVAREHHKGRRLLVVTTNLDARRPVVWDMGAIAASPSPGAIDLFRRVMAASASIPGAFSPVLIPAEAQGHRFEEMHVDGGVISNIFVLPADLALGGAAMPRRARIHVIMNGRTEPSFELAEPRATDLVGRTIWLMTQVRSVSILRVTEAFARRNGVGFRITSILSDFPEGGSMGFDTAHMRRLYAIGRELGRTGEAWRDGLRVDTAPSRATAARSGAPCASGTFRNC